MLFSVNIGIDGALIGHYRKCQTKIYLRELLFVTLLENNNNEIRLESLEYDVIIMNRDVRFRTEVEMNANLSKHEKQEIQGRTRDY